MKPDKKQTKKKPAKKKANKKQRKKKLARPRAGRPEFLPASAINQAFLHEVFTMSKYHMTNIGIGDALGMTRQTFNDYLLRYPEIREALRIGRGGGGFEIDKTLYNKCLDGDMTAIRWFDLTRRKISPEKPNIDEEAKTKIDLTLLTDQELKQFEQLARKAIPESIDIEGEYTSSVND